MMNLYFPQMLAKALGTRPLGSVLIGRRDVSTSDRRQAVWVYASLNGICQGAGPFKRIVLM